MRPAKGTSLASVDQYLPKQPKEKVMIGWVVGTNQQTGQRTLRHFFFQRSIHARKDDSHIRESVFGMSNLLISISYSKKNHAFTQNK